MSKKIIACLALVVALVLTLSVSASAAVVKDSVAYNDAPKYKDPGFDIIVTPFRDLNNTSDEKLKGDMDNLEAAYKELKDADKISDILDEGDLRKSISGKEEGKYDVNRLKVDDIFDVYTENEGSWDFTFKPDYDENDVLAIGFKDVDGNWTVLDYTENADGTVTVKLDSNGTIVVLVDNEGKKDSGYSADTGDTSNTVVWTGVLCVALVGIAAVAVSFKATKKKENA